MAGMSVLINRLGTMTAAERARLGQASAGLMSGRNLLGLRYGAGARVVDTQSGRAGVVLSGDREPITHYERYRVKLEDGREVTRSERELEADRTPAPAGR